MYYIIFSIIIIIIIGIIYYNINIESMKNIINIINTNREYPIRYKNYNGYQDNYYNDFDMYNYFTYPYIRYYWK